MRRPPRKGRRAAPLPGGDDAPLAKAAHCAGPIRALTNAAVGVAVVAVVAASIAVALGVGFVGGARARSGAGFAVVEHTGGDLAA